ncbi:VOC family protein [Achromobacter xylosoxidans]|uniref:VOC family protein n=1 Tax=Alcaligenes xylosoxydans xylosoxydans TaxID=85698 RepID=UPI001CBC6F64|nr:VOC family protein [Achromobacter xylosoxidans]
MNSRLLTRRIKRDRAIHERIVWLPIAQDIAMPLSALLHTTDLAATRDFYGSVLGFTVTDSAEGTLTVEQHGGRLIFTTLDLWKRAPGFSGTLYFSLPDVEAFYRQVKDKTPIAWPLQRMAYGSHEFGLVDGNGYTLAFVQGV